MGHKHILQWLIRLALIAAIAVSILVMYFLQQIDQIINGTLYNYGLQMNNAWYGPYSSFAWIIYTCLSVIAILSGLSLIIGLKAYKNEAQISVESKKPIQLEADTSIPQEQDSDNVNSSCPHCKKTFTKPIVMLNFEGGKTKLVNVCPHCSHTLGSAEEK